MSINSKGYILVELLAVIVILGILSGIAVLSVPRIIEKSKEEVCHVNILQLEKMYEAYLEFEGINHSEVVFNSYLQSYGEDICPEDGVISYTEGKVECSLHPRMNDNGDEGDNGVPYL